MVTVNRPVGVNVDALKSLDCHSVPASRNNLYQFTTN